MSTRPALDWLRKQLRADGKSQRGLASHLGRDPAAITHLLQGKRSVKADDISAIADYLGVPAADVAAKLGIIAEGAAGGGLARIQLDHRVTFDQAQRIFAILNEGR